MAKSKNDYLDRLLGVNPVNADTGLSDPESREALSGYEKPNSLYRTNFGDMSQGRGYDPTNSSAVVYRGNDIDYENTKGRSDDSWVQIPSSVGRFIGQTTAKIGIGAAFVGSMLGEAASEGLLAATGNANKIKGGFIANSADNWLVDMFKNMDEGTKNLFPVFKTFNYQQQGVLKQIGSAEFWESDVIDGLAFAASAYLTGAALTSGLNLGAKSAELLGIGTKAQRAAVAAGETTLPNVSRFINSVDFTTNVAANTTIESMFEAKDVRDSILSDPSLAAKFTPEEIQKIAAEKARDVFGLNMLFVAPSNMFELASLAGKTAKGANRASRLADNFVGMDAAAQYQKLSPKWYQKPAFQLGKALTTNALTEGLYEENIQYLIQEVSKFNAHKGPGQSFTDSIGKLLSNVAEGDLNSEFTKEQSQSVVLGGIIGAGMQASHLSPKVNKLFGGDGGIYQNYKDKLAKRDELYNSLTNTSGSASSLDIFQRETPVDHTFTKEVQEDGTEKTYMQREDGEKREITPFTWKALVTNAGLDLEKGGTAKMGMHKLDDKGSPMLDPIKLEKMFTATKRREELNAIHDALLEEPEKNKFSLQIVKAAMIADVAFAHFEAGLGKQLEQKLGSIANADKASLNAVNASAISNPLELESAKEYVAALENLYNSLEVGIVNRNADPKKQMERKQVMFDRAARILTLDKMQKDLAKETADLFNKVKLSTEELANVFEAEQAANLLEALDKMDRGSQESTGRNLYNEGALQGRRAEATDMGALVSSFMDTIDQEKVRKDKPEFQSLMSNLFKLQDLTESRKELFEEWKNVSDLYKGEKYFLDNYDGISKKYDYITDSIDIKKATVVEYLNWEKTKLPAMRIRAKLQQVNKDYLNKYIKDVLSSGRSLVEVLDWAIANEVALSDYHIEMILDEISDFQEATKGQDKVLAELKEEREAAQDEGYTEEQIKALDENILALQTELDAAKQNLGSYFNISPSDITNILLELRYRSDFSGYDPIDFKEDLANTLLGFVDATMAAFNNNESYDDLEAVEEALETVESLLSIFKKRSDTKSFTGYKQELQDKIDELKKALEVVTDRHLNKFRKEYNRVNKLADAMLDVLADPAIQTYVPNHGEIRAALEQDKQEREDQEKTKEERVRTPVGTNIFALLGTLSGNSELSKAVFAKQLAKVNEFLNTHPSMKYLQDIPMWNRLFKTFAEAAQSNPIRAIKGLLLTVLSNKSRGVGQYGYDVGPESSLGRYLSEGDVNDLIDSLEAGEQRPDNVMMSTEDLLAIAKLLKELEALNILETFARTDSAFIPFISKLEADIKTNEAKAKSGNEFTPAPSILQSFVIAQIYNAIQYLLSTVKPGMVRSPFTNWVYFKGPAGSGKTFLVIRYALKALGITSEGVVTAGHNVHSADSIKKSLGNADTYAKDKLIEALSSKAIPATARLLVIDEIGGFSQTEVDQISKLAATNYPNLPIVVMGDPNQVTSSTRDTVALELGYSSDEMLSGIHRVIDIAPLFTRYRSDNPAIVNLQDSFLKRSTELTDAVGVSNVDSNQITSTEKLLSGTYIDSTAAMLLPILYNAVAKNPNRTRAIIVANDEVKATYQAQLEQKLPGSTVEVLTYIESQGRTIDEVYVTIPNDKSAFKDIIQYSQALYTATSRAKEFVYLGNVKNAKNKVDEQLVEKSQSIKNQKQDNFAGILAYLASAKTILSRLGVSVTDETSAEEEKKEDSETEMEESDRNENLDLAELLGEEETSKKKKSRRDDREEDDKPISQRDDSQEQGKTTEDHTNNTEDFVEDEPNTDELDNTHTEKTIEEEIKEQETPITTENTSPNSISLLESSSNVFNEMYIDYEGERIKVFDGINSFIKGNKNLDVELINTVSAEGNVQKVIIARRSTEYPKLFVVMGVLTDEELPLYQASNLPEVTYRQKAHNVYEINNLPAGATKSYRVDLNKTKPTVYRYTAARRKFNVYDVFDKWVNSFFGKVRSLRGETLSSDYVFELSNAEKVKDNLKIIIPNTRDLSSSGKYSELAESGVVQAGKPFLLLRGALVNRTTKGNKTLSAPQKDQAILLTPRLLSLHNKLHMEQYIDPMQDYITAVKRLERVIAENLRDKSVAAKYKLGTAEFSILVTHLSNVYANRTVEGYSLGKNTSFDPADKNYGYLFDLFETQALSVIDETNHLFHFASLVDIDIHGEYKDRIILAKKGSNKETDEKEKTFKRNYQGKVQKAFDRLARANLWTTVDNKAILLRDTRTVTYVTKEGKVNSKAVVTGRNLLGWASVNQEDTVSAKFNSKIKGYLAQATARSKKLFEANKIAQPIDFNAFSRVVDPQTGRKILTSDELTAIFGVDAFSNNGEHGGKRGSGLRIPISRKIFNDKKLSDLEKEVSLADYFDDTFDRVEPNRIAIFDPAKEAKVQQAQSDKKTIDTAIKKAEAENKPEKVQELEQLKEQVVAEENSILDEFKNLGIDTDNLEDDDFSDWPTGAYNPPNPISKLYKKLIDGGKEWKVYYDTVIKNAVDLNTVLDSVVYYSDLQKYTSNKTALKIKQDQLPEAIKKAELIDLPESFITYLKNYYDYATATKELRDDDTVYITLDDSISGTGGVYLAMTGTVIGKYHYNSTKSQIARDRLVLRHEFLHSVLFHLSRTNLSKFKDLASKLKRSKHFNTPIAKYNGLSINELLQKYYTHYGTNTTVLDNEALTIFFTEVAEGNLKLDKSTITVIKHWLRKLLATIGLENLLYSDDLDVERLSEGLAAAFNQGVTLKAITKKGKESLQKPTQAPEEPVDMKQLYELYLKFNPQTFQQVIKSWLGGVKARNAAEEHMFQIINGAMLSHVEGKEKYGLFKAGTVYIEKGLSATKAKDILTHEIFHKVFRSFLSVQERDAVIADAKTKYPLLEGSTDLEVEHFLIETFNGYIYKPTNLFGRLALLFDKLLFRIGLFNRSMNSVDQFFKQLYSGYYAGHGTYTDTETVSADKLEKYFNGNLALYQKAKTLTLIYIRRKYSFDYIEANAKTAEEKWANPPYTFEEAAKELPLTMGRSLARWMKDNPGQSLSEEMAVMHLLTFNAKAREEILRTLFPDIKASDVQSVADEEEEIENSKFDYLKDNELIDQQRSVVKNVKQILSTIQYTDKAGKTSYVPYATSYAILIRLMNGLDTEGKLDKQIEFLNRKMVDIGGTPESRALYNFVSNLVNGMIIDDAGKAEQIVYKGPNSLGIRTDTFSYSATKREGETQTTFLRRVYTELKDKGFTMKEVYESYRLYHYRNVYAQLASTIRSLRKQTNYVGVREKVLGNYVYKYFVNRESGSKASVIAILQGHILDLYKKDPKVFTTVQWKTFTQERVKNPPNKEQEDTRVKQVIGLFMNTLGFNPRIRIKELMESEAIQQGDLNFIYDAIINFSRRLQDATSEKSTVNLEDFILATENTFFKTIQDALQFSDPDFQASSSIRGDGKRVYPYVNSSFAMDVLNYFIYKDKWRGSFFTPKFLNTDFYQKNIFIKGDSTIRSVIDHDSIKYKGLDNTAKLFKNETSLDWYARNFLYGFIGAMETKERNNLSYFQFLDTPSNKPKTNAVDVDLLNMAKAKALLAEMREQEKLRPKLNIANYTPGTSYVATDEVLDQEVDKFLDQLIYNNVLSLVNLEAVYSKLGRAVAWPSPEIQTKAKAILEKLKEKAENLERFITSTKEVTELEEEDKVAIDQTIDAMNEDALDTLELSDVETLLAYYRPVAELFTYNHYVNSHQLRQLVIGDPAFFKIGTEAYDIIKRMSLAIAPGKVGAVNEQFGFMKPKIRVSVGEDLVKLTEDPEIQKLLVKYEATDAQGFVTPEFAERIRKSYGYEEGLDVVMKPVHFEIDESGVPRALKFSVIEITDELAAKFAGLGQLRMLMEKNNADIHTFPSAVKIGAPATLSKNTNPDFEVPDALHPDSIITLNAANFRIQLNPAHDAISHTANASQLTYQGIVNKENLAPLMRINQLNAAMIALGSKRLGKIFQLRNNRATAKTERVVRGLAMKNWFDMPGFEGLWTLVNNDNININVPILQKSLESLISSNFTRNSIAFRFLGSKLVLQAEYGTSVVNRDGKQFKEPLKWKDDMQWTECYVPESWRERYNLKPGDSISIKNGKIVAFRLPSTGLHSALVMQIKDFYPTPEGKKANVVIAPHEIVYKHGSDYDVDALFVMMKKKVKELFNLDDEGKFDLGAVMQLIDKDAPSLILEGNDDVGEAEGKPILINGRPLFEAVQDYILMMDKELETIFSRRKDEWTSKEVEYVAMANGNYGDDGVYHMLTSVLQELIKNEIVDTFAEMLTDPENKYWMDLPITMDRLKGVSNEGAGKTALDVVSEIRGLEVQPKHKELYEHVDLSLITNQQKMHYNSYSGAQLVGVAANSYKGFSHVFMSTKTLTWQDIKTKKVYTREDLRAVHENVNVAITMLKGENKFLVPKTKEIPEVKPELGIKLNGAVWNTLSHQEREVVTNEDGTTELVPRVTKLGPNNEEEFSEKVYSIWETFDSLINACIDNVKEQIVYLLNLTGQTANEWFTLLALGVPLETAVRFMGQPIIYDLSVKGTLNENTLNKYIMNLVKVIASNNSIKLANKEETKAYQKELFNSINAIELNDENLSETSQAYWMNDNNIYALTNDQLMHQIKVAYEFNKLTEIGKSMFDLSRALSILRSFPTNYWEQRDVLDLMLTKISDFGQEEMAARINDLEKDSKAAQKRITEAKNRSTMLQELAEGDLTHQERLRQANDKIVSSVINSDVNNYTKGVKAWSFTNSSVLSIPNVQQALKVLQRLVRMQEQLFYRHSTAMNNFIEGISKNLDLSSFVFKKKWKAYDKFKSDFMQFLLSGITLDFKNVSYEVKIDPTLTHTDGKGFKKYGFKAWAMHLIDDLRELRKAYPDNPFLNAVEFGFNKEEKMTTIVFTSDKSKTAMENLVYKHAFNQLNNETVLAWEKKKGISHVPNQEFLDIQLRLFHYLLATQGTEFGRTSFSMVMPDRMYEVYSDVFQDHMKKTLDRNGISKFLEKLGDQFVLQFVTNNIPLLPSIRKDDPRVATDLDYADFTMHFGLALKHTEDEDGNAKEYKPKQFVARYGDAYIYVGTENGYDLYQKISYKSGTKYYALPQKFINSDESFQLSKVFNGTLILPKEQGYEPLSGTYSTLANVKQVPRVGETIYLHSTSDMSYTNVEKYQVIAVEVNKAVTPKDKETPAYFYQLLALGKLDYSADADATAPVSAPLQSPPDLEAMVNQMKEAIAKNGTVDEEGVIQVQRPSYKRGAEVVAKLKAIIQDKGIRLDAFKNVYSAFDRDYKRLTEWTREIFKDAYDKDIFTYRAEKDFEKQKLPLNGTYMDTTGKTPIPYTFEERVAFHKDKINSAAAAGRVIHAYIEYLAETDPKEKDKIAQKLKDLASEKKDEKGNIIQQRVNTYFTKWLTEDAVQAILNKAGINTNIKSKEMTPGQDHMLAELTAFSDSLGYGTQIDGLVVHPNGDFSIVDWKTGKLFSDEFTNKVFKYAEGMPASKLNTAKLEVVLRAYALKEMMGGDAKFRKLSLGLISKAKGVHMVDIEIADYLKVIENYVKATTPSKYKELKAKGAFEAKQYLSQSQSFSRFRTNIEQMDPIQQKDYLEKKLRSMSVSYSQEQINNNKTLKEEYMELTRVRLELEGRDDLSYNDEDQDISKYQRYLYNLKDMPSKFLKSFATALFNRKALKDKEYDEYEHKFDTKLNVVLKEYFDSKPTLKALVKLTRGNVNYIPFMNTLNKKELFAFMWDKKDANGYHGYFANTMDYYYDLNGNKKELTAAQKDFRDFYQTSMRDKYAQVTNKKVFDSNDKESTLGIEQGYDPLLDPVFMPRVSKNTSDLVEDMRGLNEGLYAAGQDTLKVMQIKLKEAAAAMSEDPYTGDQTGIPIRFMPASDSKVIQDEMHSFDVERAGKAFMKDLINKDHMEDVYSLAKGLKTFYMSATDRKGNPAMPKLTAFMNDVIFAHVLERAPEEKLTGKSFSVPVTERTANSYIGKMLDLKPGTALNFSFEKLLMLAKNFTSAIGMALKPIQGAWNAGLIIMTNGLRGLSNSVSSVAFGNKDIDYGVNDLNWAHKIVILDSVLPNLKRKPSKIQNIAKKTRFLTDNYDYEALNKGLVAGKNHWFNISSLFVFHSVWENYGQMILLAAMMNRTKVTMPDGSVKSMYELYDDNGDYQGPVRGVVTDKLGNKTELKGLDAREVGRMKRVSEKLHGSYRKEERIMAELDIVGQMVFQFKKYLPGLIKNNWRLTFEDQNLGKYMLKVDENGIPIKPDGIDEYEWIDMKVTGRVPLLAMFLIQTIQKFTSPNSPYRRDDLTWENLSSQQKQELMNVFLTFLVIAIGIVIRAMAGDDYRNKAWFKKLLRLLEDLTLGLNPMDILRPVKENLVPSASKVVDLVDAVTEFLGEGVVGEIDSRGLPKGAYNIMKNVPIGSAIHAYNYFIKDLEGGDDNLFFFEK